METLFWIITILLVFIATGFLILPLRLLKSEAGYKKLNIILIAFSIILVSASYGLYRHWGSGDLLGKYYNQEAIDLRQKQIAVRPVFNKIGKQILKSKLAK